MMSGLVAASAQGGGERRGAGGQRWVPGTEEVGLACAAWASLSHPSSHRRQGWGPGWMGRLCLPLPTNTAAFGAQGWGGTGGFGAGTAAVHTRGSTLGNRGCQRWVFTFLEHPSGGEGVHMACGIIRESSRLPTPSRPSCKSNHSEHPR